MGANKGFVSPVAKMAAAAWSAITGKPSAFPPSSHTHLWADLTDKPTTFAPSSHNHAWADVTGKPTTFTPSTHSHAISDVTGLQAAIDAKGPIIVGQVTIAETSLITLALGVRRVTVALTGTVTTGAYVAVPVSAPPAGYSIQDCYCSINGQITVGLIVPALGIATNYSIPVRIFRLN